MQNTAQGLGLTHSHGGIASAAADDASGRRACDQCRLKKVRHITTLIQGGRYWRRSSGPIVVSQTLTGLRLFGVIKTGHALIAARPNDLVPPRVSAIG
ncbi:hypothetical protein E4U32_003901 [Claviceps aff. humidiphila group G2b]|nr:hypothetical protein E4U32_003901 [Claviceps aff. humidiphila group G2b]